MPPAYNPYATSASAPSPTPAPKAERSNGLHLSIGAGFASGGGRPGIGTQFKIGGRLSQDLVLYYYALNDWFKTFPPSGYWRIAAINGLGVDYFVVPHLGVRFAAGIGMNGPTDMSSNDSHKRYYGYSYVMGLTCDLGDEKSHFSIDPTIHVLQVKVGSQWESSPFFLLTANWVWN